GASPSRSLALPRRSPRLEHLEHGPVELAAVPVFVGDVVSAAVADAEAAGEVPQGPAPAGLLDLLERVVHPGQDEPVGREVMGAELTDHHTDALGLEVLPGLDHVAGDRAAGDVLAVVLPQ